MAPYITGAEIQRGASPAYKQAGKMLDAPLLASKTYMQLWENPQNFTRTIDPYLRDLHRF